MRLRVAETITSWAISPDDRTLAFWGRAQDGSFKCPSGTVTCVDLDSAHEIVRLEGSAQCVGDALFVAPDRLWVLRYPRVEGSVELTVYGLPEGDILERRTVDGVGAFASLQLAEAGGTVLIADDELGLDIARRNSGDSERVLDARWHLLDAENARTLREIAPYRIAAVDPRTGENAWLDGSESVVASLSPSGRTVLARVDLNDETAGDAGRLILVGEREENSTMLAGAAARYNRGLLWLSEERVAHLSVSLSDEEEGRFSAAPRLVIVSIDGREPTLDLRPEAFANAKGGDRITEWRGHALWMDYDAPRAALLVAGTTRDDDGYGIVSRVDLGSHRCAGSVDTTRAHPNASARLFDARWIDRERIIMTLASGDSTVVATLDARTWQPAGAPRHLAVPPDASLMRLHPSRMRRFVVMDWYEKSQEGWTAVLIPCDE